MSTFDEPPQDVERPTVSDDKDDALLNGDFEIERSPGFNRKSVENPGACACRFCEDEFSSTLAESRHTCQDRRQLEWDTDYESPELVEPNTHGVGANLLFSGNGLSPYFGIGKAIDYLLNNDVPTFQYAGREWEFVFKDNIPDRWDEKGYTRYWKGKIAARPEDSADAFYEYQIGIRARDYVGVMKATFQFRPSLPNATHVDSGEQIQSLPEDLPEGLRVQASTSNIPVDNITGLLRAMAEQLGVNTSYFAESKIHEWSRIYNLEQYVRISRNASKRLVGSGGVLSRLADFSMDYRGSVGALKWNNEGVQGNITRFVVNRETWNRLLRDSVLAKRIKHYHPEHARKHESEDDPLSSPKVEVQYSNKFNRGNSIPWEQRHEAIRELDESLINVLHWADVDVRPNSDVYVSDAYFDGTAGSHRDIVVFEDPTPQAKSREEDLTVQRLLDSNLGEKERAVVAALVDSPEFERHYTDLAADAESSTSTVYRLVEKLRDLLRVENGIISFQDSIIEDQATSILERVAKVGEWAKNSIEQLVEVERALESEDTALARWMNAHGIQLVRTEKGRTFDLSNLQRTTAEVRELLREGYRAAVRSPFKTEDFQDAMFRWSTVDGNTQHQNPFHYFGSNLRVLGRHVDYG